MCSTSREEISEQKSAFINSTREIVVGIWLISLISSWLVSKEITPLHDHEIKAWLEQTHRKSTPNGLRAAYETAKDPSEWISKLAPVDDEPEAEEEEEDQLEDDAEEVGGGKRKRAAEKKDRKKAAKVNKKAKVGLDFSMVLGGVRNRATSTWIRCVGPT